MRVLNLVAGQKWTGTAAVVFDQTAALVDAGVEAQFAFVGDSPEFDVDPPAALGMYPVLIDRRERHPSFDGVRIQRLTELAGVLEAA